jgi:hypothetical protein
VSAEKFKHMALSALSEDERDNYEERAAIKEYDGGMSRETAESQALQEITATAWPKSPCDNIKNELWIDLFTSVRFARVP